jgi:organic hydroperoxide reductase OsmC/OhrA
VFLVACFLSALQAVARQQGKSDLVKNAAVTAEVHIGPPMDLVGPVPQVTCAFEIDCLLAWIWYCRRHQSLWRH